jgi:23S rRNA (adenine2503-C2)-methyltransferase
MSRALNGAGVLTRLRWSAGQDVEGGCGQLRARHRSPTAPAPTAAGQSVISLVARGPGTGDAAWH